MNQSNQIKVSKHITWLTFSYFMANGTRQGSRLSPYRFALYIRWVSGKILKSGAGCHMGGVPYNILLYADDMVVFARSDTTGRLSCIFPDFKIGNESLVFV